MPTTKKKTTTRRSAGAKKAKPSSKKLVSRFPIIHSDSEGDNVTWHDVMLHKIMGGAFILSIVVVGTIGMAFYLVEASGQGDAARHKSLYAPVAFVSPSVTPSLNSGMREERTDSGDDINGRDDGDISVSPLAVEIRNGTRISGRAGDVAEELKGMDNNLTILGIGNASRLDYAYSMVIDRSGDNEGVADIVKYFEARWVSELPEGEEESEADVIVILGAQK